MEPTLFMITGKNSEGPWRCFVEARSPGQALDYALKSHTWLIGEVLVVEMITDFARYDDVKSAPSS